MGLLSDIHGNADALGAVLKEARQLGVEHLLIVGDFIGYYHQPAAVLEHLEEWSFDAVRGNHEVLFSQWLSNNGRREILQKFGHGLAVAEAELSGERQRELLSLPDNRRLKFDGRSVFLCHGTPGDPNRYVYPDADEAAFDIYFETGASLIVCGHTHYHARKTRGDQMMVNPGSVGQPRDRNPAAAWATWDTVTNEATHRRTDWTQDRIKKLAKQHDPNITYLVEVLERADSTDGR